MTSFIVQSTDQKKRELYIKSFVVEEKIDTYDLTFLGKELSKNQNSIGIDEIKNLQVKIFLKPIKSEKKAIIIDDAESLTIEAQNALLKALEEPPQHTIMILSTNNIDALLPTILSRCQIVKISNTPSALTEQEKKEIETFLSMLPNTKIGDRLKLAEELGKDKDKAIERITKIVLVLRENMLKKGTEADIEVSQIKSLQELLILLKHTNVNPRFAIEDTLLSLNS
ncbi:MAG TPA: AAA family ATPase [Candidatus Limnocylindrales bacterium]|nr:AAA family ATPase [Candidatus Limnocylindrales bacterium]